MRSPKPNIDPEAFFPAAAIDTSLRPGSAAIALGETDIKGQELPEGGDQAALLFSALESLVDTQGISPEAIKLIVVGLGPGSFTGLRAGAAAAGTLASFLPAKLVALPSCMGTTLAGEKGCRAICLNALRGDVQGAIFKDGIEIQPPLLTSPVEFCSLLARTTGTDHKGIVGGDGVELLDQSGSLPPAWEITRDENCWIPQADLLLKRGLQLAREGKTTPPEALEPLYLRLSAAEESAKEN